MNLGSVKSLDFNAVNVQLFTEVFDVSAVKPVSASASLKNCFRCKSTAHLVHQCAFQASTKMALQSEASHQKTGPDKATTSGLHDTRQSVTEYITSCFPGGRATFSTRA